MPATATVTYSAQGSPDTILIFDLIGADVNYIHRELPLKKNELDEKFNVDLRKVPLISTMLQSR
ncbi:MAG TPA: hypothetical protein VIP70_08640 [Nitrososphaeraceae archaeon]